MAWWKHPLRGTRTERVDLSRTFGTRDGLSMTLDGAITYRVTPSRRQRRAPDDPRMAVEQLTITALRTAIGELDRSAVAEARQHLETTASHVLTEVMDGWGLADVSVAIERIAPDQPDPSTGRS